MNFKSKHFSSIGANVPSIAVRCGDRSKNVELISKAK